VVEARYEAGKFGSGYKHRLKSGTSIRWIPLAAAVAAAIARRVPADIGPLAIVFTGPGGGNRVKAGTRTALSRGNLRRVYRTPLPEPTSRTCSCTAPRLAAHVRDLAGGRRHPGACDR
jgi:hypothetical protein